MEIQEVIQNLIYDRTENDVKLLTNKGIYRAEDCNRVETAVRFLSDFLAILPIELKEYSESKNIAWSETIFGVPYDVKEYGDSIITKTDWDMYGQFFGVAIAPTIYENQERYLGNVYKLRKAIEFTYPELPLSMNRLTWYHANAIEKTLKLLYDGIIKLKDDRIQKINSVEINAYSGEFYSADFPFVQYSLN